MDRCRKCGFWDAYYEMCGCPSMDKWYACPIEAEKSKNVKARSRGMKFLQIGDGLYINAERIDGVCPGRTGELKVFVGGSDEVWTVDKSYANDVLAIVHGKGAEE